MEGILTMVDATAVKVEEMETEDVKPDIKPKLEYHSDEECNDNNGSLNVEKLKIPRKLIQRVVGKDNCNVENIAAFTGALIEVGADGEPESTIEIKGSKVATKRARELLTALKIDPNVDLKKLMERPSGGECSTSTTTSNEKGPIILSVKSLRRELEQDNSGGKKPSANDKKMAQPVIRNSVRLANKRLSSKRGVSFSYGSTVTPPSSNALKHTSIFNNAQTASTSKLALGVQMGKNLFPNPRDQSTSENGKGCLPSLIKITSTQDQRSDEGSRIKQTEPTKGQLGNIPSRGVVSSFERGVIMPDNKTKRGSADGLQAQSSSTSALSYELQRTQQSSRQLTLGNEAGTTGYSKKVSGPYCKLCKLEFITNKDLKVHCGIHGMVFKGLTKLGDLGCSCGRTFPSKVKLDDHKTKTFCFKCLQCFKFPSGKRIHNLKHTNERKFVCNICSKGYKGEANYALHVLRASCSKTKQILGK